MPTIMLQPIVEEEHKKKGVKNSQKTEDNEADTGVVAGQTSIPGELDLGKHEMLTLHLSVSAYLNFEP